jgi:superfamily II DNA or RNA helicase
MAELRPRQIKAIADVRAAYATGHRRVLLVASTGFGKTHTAAEIIKSAIARGNNVWFLAHLREILDDTARRLEAADIPHGFIMAGMPRNPFKPVQIVSVQTAVRRPVARKPGLIIVDECHLAVADTYKKVVEAAGNPPLLGLTGTPARLDSRGLGEMFDVMVPTCSTGDLIAEGLLAPIRYYAPTKPDLTGIRSRAGDFALDQLAEAVDRPSIIGDAVAHYRKHAHGRRAVAFCVNIAHAEHTAAAFTAAGYRAVAISGNSTRQERQDALTGLRQGTIDIVCNCALWVAGVDCPEIGCVILLRPTKSLTMYLQSVGRGLRTCAGKPDLIVLDHASCVFTHGLPQDPREWTLDAKPKRAGANAPSVRECPSCFACHAPAPACPCCGHVYVRETVPQGPEQVDGELVEVDEAALRRQRNREQAQAQTLEQLIEIGRRRGMKSPYGWAKHVLAARQRRKSAA